MPKTPKKARNAAAIKRELEIAERELKRITEFQWTYAKRMLKFGFASWIFGVSAFFSVLIIYDSRLLRGRLHQSLGHFLFSQQQFQL